MFEGIKHYKGSKNLRSQDCGKKGSAEHWMPLFPCRYLPMGKGGGG